MKFAYLFPRLAAFGLAATRSRRPFRFRSSLFRLLGSLNNDWMSTVGLSRADLRLQIIPLPTVANQILARTFFRSVANSLASPAVGKFSRASSAGGVGNAAHDGVPAIVMAIHTFGEYLDFHPHLHALVADKI